MYKPTKVQVRQAIDTAIMAVAEMNGGLSQAEQERLRSYVRQPQCTFGTWEYHGSKCPAAYAGMDRERKIVKEFAKVFDEEMARVTELQRQDDGSVGAYTGKMALEEGEVPQVFPGGPAGR